MHCIQAHAHAADTHSIQLVTSSAATSIACADLHRALLHHRRLQPLELASTRPLPANGKIVVRRGDTRAEALLQLPALPVRSSSEGPAALWLTVGLLAVDGLALQLRLKKHEKVCGRGQLMLLPAWLLHTTGFLAEPRCSSSRSYTHLVLVHSCDSRVEVTCACSHGPSMPLPCSDCSSLQQSGPTACPGGTHAPARHMTPCLPPCRSPPSVTRWRACGTHTTQWEEPSRCSKTEEWGIWGHTVMITMKDLHSCSHALWHWHVVATHLPV